MRCVPNNLILRKCCEVAARNQHPLYPHLPSASEFPTPWIRFKIDLYPDLAPTEPDFRYFTPTSPMGKLGCEGIIQNHDDINKPYSACIIYKSKSKVSISRFIKTEIFTIRAKNLIVFLAACIAIETATMPRLRKIYSRYKFRHSEHHVARHILLRNIIDSSTYKTKDEKNFHKIDPWRGFTLNAYMEHRYGKNALVLEESKKTMQLVEISMKSLIATGELSCEGGVIKLQPKSLESLYFWETELRRYRANLYTQIAIAIAAIFALIR